MRNLTKEEHEYLSDNDQVEIDGVLFTIVETEEEMDDNFKNLTHYLADDKGNHIMIFETLIRYGYEDYGYESSYQELEVFEVEKKEVVVTRWVTKK
ncbi:hypothetical protein PDK35_02505 [Bacillus cereus group sp. TH153LC]|uniref:hypothetical protein n=1 Tax=Bacillus cereus group sp. TH153LC TaxID=3018059 RepID=UPI0022E4B375|nr:hypothetical protein [Bacillus cereus group sp. TH153LC]MDA1658847.1 hypothetical protein [Bacillus cereus group sp. TH153LC]